MTYTLKVPARCTVAQLRHALAVASAELGSQRALADKIGVTESYISAVVRGRQLPGRGLLRALGLALTEAEPSYAKVRK